MPRPSPRAARRSSHAPLLSCINGTTSASCITDGILYNVDGWYELEGDHTSTMLPQTVFSGFRQPYSQEGSPDSDFVMTNFPFFAIGSSPGWWTLRGYGGWWSTDDKATGECE